MKSRIVEIIWDKIEVIITGEQQQNKNMLNENLSQKTFEQILKSSQGMTKRQIGILRRNYECQDLINVKYPEFLIYSIYHDQQIQQFLHQLDLITQVYCQNKKQRKQFFIRKVCQHLFSCEEKRILKAILGRQFIEGGKDVESSEESGAKTLYQLLHFIYNVPEQET